MSRDVVSIKIAIDKFMWRLEPLIIKSLSIDKAVSCSLCDTNIMKGIWDKYKTKNKSDNQDIEQVFQVSLIDTNPCIIFELAIYGIINEKVITMFADNQQDYATNSLICNAFNNLATSMGYENYLTYCYNTFIKETEYYVESKNNKLYISQDNKLFKALK